NSDYVVFVACLVLRFGQLLALVPLVDGGPNNAEPLCFDNLRIKAVNGVAIGRRHVPVGAEISRWRRTPINIGFRPIGMGPWLRAPRVAAETPIVGRQSI